MLTGGAIDCDIEFVEDSFFCGVGHGSDCILKLNLQPWPFFTFYLDMATHQFRESF
ncbi:MAG: hypothetical protein ACI89U_002956 [Gammaproteobacteria bacterium]|jgi:hypothetical protein